MGLAVSVHLDVRSARPNQPTRAHLVVVLGATADEARRERERLPSRTILAIDASRSMGGEPLDHVKRSVDRMLDMISPEDEVGVVAFSDGASEVAPPKKLDESGKRLIRSRVMRLTVSANTNIEAGLSLAASMMSYDGLPKGARKSIVLLSDGAPNRGVYTAEGLREVAKKHRPGISTFALGYGRDHSEDVLSAIGDAGGAGYEYVPDPATCSRAFARALGAQADVVASGIEVVIGLADGVELKRFLGREEMRIGKGGVIVTLPDMVAGARRVLVAEIDIAAPGAEKFLAHVADVSVKTNTGAVAEPETLDVEIADRDPLVHPAGAREVLLVRADVTRDEARHLADCGHFQPAARVIRTFLPEIERCPGFVLNDGSALAEAYEQLVDEAVAYERQPSFDEYRELRKTTMGSKLSVSAPESARDRGPMSRRYLEHIAGKMPDAYLVIGDTRHRLREENVVGRTASADIVVTCAQVTRRQAGVNCLDGKFHVVDFGSTNMTLVNGRPIGTVPHVLKHGDVIRVGTVDLRYEEAAGAPAP